MKKLYFLFAALAGLMLVLSLPHSAVAKKEKKNKEHKKQTINYYTTTISEQMH